MRPWSVVFLTLFASISIFPQQPTPLVEAIEVRVANVDVVVRDHAGNPVVGLTKYDFVLYDDKKQQTITNFYEVRHGEDPTAPPGAEPDVPLEVRRKRIVVFVDAASITPVRKKKVLDSLNRFLDHMRPEDQCMLVAWRSKLEIITPFTHDKQILAKGIEAISHFDAGGERSAEMINRVRLFVQSEIHDAELGFVGWGEAYNNSRLTVNRYGERLLVEERQLADALDTITTTMAGLDGKKVLLLVSEALPKSPAAELYTYVNEEIGPHLPRQANTAWSETATGIPGSNVEQLIDNFAHTASERGVTVYTIGTAATDSDIASDEKTPVDHTYTFARDANTASTLQDIAEVTGGVAITRTSNFDLAFDTISRDLSSYYSLGYKPVGEGGKRHNIVVKTKDSAYTVRARQSFVVQSTDDQMSDRVVANLYVEPGKNDWPISVRTAPPQRDGKNFVVPLEVEIPSTMTMIPQEDKLAASFVLYLAVGDSQGKTSTVIRRPEELRIPPSLESTVRAKPIRFKNAVRVKPGECVLSVAVFDQLSGAMGFARTTITAR